MRIQLAVALVVAGLCTPAVVYAAPGNSNVPTHVSFTKSKTVKMTLRNDSGSPLELKVGEEVMSLDAGKAVAVKVPVGTRIVVNATTSKHQAGDLLAEATTSLDNTTIAIK